jgi:uncharacterized protein with LGFP repeats
VRGGILEKYRSAGGPATAGFPVADDSQAPGGRGYLSAFQSGTVYWSAATGAHLVLDPVDDAYRAQGGPDSSLGYPITDTYAVPEGLRVDLQNGQITR